MMQQWHELYSTTKEKLKRYNGLGQEQGGNVRARRGSWSKETIFRF